VEEDRETGRLGDWETKALVERGKRLLSRITRAHSGSFSIALAEAREEKTG